MLMKFSQNQLKQAYEGQRRYIATYNDIQVIEYSSAQKQFYLRSIYSDPMRTQHFSKRGRYDIYDEIEINKLLNFNLLNE